MMSRGWLRFSLQFSLALVAATLIHGVQAGLLAYQGGDEELFNGLLPTSAIELEGDDDDPVTFDPPLGAVLSSFVVEGEGWENLAVGIGANCVGMSTFGSVTADQLTNLLLGIEDNSTFSAGSPAAAGTSRRQGPGGDLPPPRGDGPAPPGAPSGPPNSSTATGSPSPTLPVTSIRVRDAQLLIVNATPVRRSIATGLRVLGIGADRIPSYDDLPASIESSPYVRLFPKSEYALPEFERGSGVMRIVIGVRNLPRCAGVAPSSASSSNVTSTTAMDAYIALKNEEAGAFNVPVFSVINVSSNYAFWYPVTFSINTPALCESGTTDLAEVLQNFVVSAGAVQAMSAFFVQPVSETSRLAVLAAVESAGTQNSSCADYFNKQPFKLAPEGFASFATPLGLQFFSFTAGSTAEMVADLPIKAVAGLDAVVGITSLTPIQNASASSGSQRRQGPGGGAVNRSNSEGDVVPSNVSYIPLAGTSVVIMMNFGQLSAGISATSGQLTVTISVCQLANIMNGTFTLWSEVGLRALGGLSPPADPIHVALDASGTSAALLRTLRQLEVQLCGVTQPTVATSLRDAVEVHGTRGQVCTGLDGCMTVLSTQPFILTFVSDYTASVALVRNAVYAAYRASVKLEALEYAPTNDGALDAFDRGTQLSDDMLVELKPLTSDGDDDLLNSFYPFLLTIYFVYIPETFPSRDGGPSCASVRNAAEFMSFAIAERRAAAVIYGEDLIWLGGYDYFKAQTKINNIRCDGELVFPVSDEKSDVAIIIGGSAGGTFFFGVVVAAIVGTVVIRKATRNNECAPKDSSEPFAIAFTDIESSTTLWARSTAEMAEALDLHHELIRQCIRKHNCYEVKTIGDAFMVASANPAALLDFALDVQDSLVDSAYPATAPAETFDKIYLDKRREMAEAAAAAGEADPYGGDESIRNITLYKSLWRGLRVRIGLHIGRGDITFDEVTKGYDYYGSVVNAASRAESSGHGGQVICTAAFAAAAKSHIDANKVSTEVKGQAVLRGFDQPVELVQVNRARFAGRFFPPLKIDAPPTQTVADDAEADGADSQDVQKQESAHPLTGPGEVTDGSFAAMESVSSFGRVGTDDAEIALIADYISVAMSAMPRKDRAKVLENIAHSWRLHAGMQHNEQQLVRWIAKRVILVAKDRAAVQGTDTPLGGASPREHEMQTMMSVNFL